VLRAAALKREHEAKIAEIKKTSDPALAITASAEAMRIEDDLARITEALHKTGTESGRSLAARKLTLDRDMSLVAVKARAKAAKGAALSEPESAKFAELAKKFAEAEKRIAELEAQRQDKSVDRAIRQSGRRIAQHLSAEERAAKIADLASRAKAMLSRGGQYGRSLDMPGENPGEEPSKKPEPPEQDFNKTIAELAMHVASQPGFDTLDKVVAELQKIVSQDITRQTVSDAIYAASNHRAKVIDETTKNIQNIRREAKADKSLRDAIDALSAHLKVGTMPEPKATSATEPTEIIAELHAILDALRKQISQSEPAQKKRLEASYNRLAQQAQELAEGRYVPAAAKPERTAASKTLERLAYERDELRRRVRQAINDLKPKTPLQRVGGAVGEPINLLRAVMTSADFSAVLRQGGFVAVGHPIRAAKAIPDMLRAAWSEVEDHRIFMETLNRPGAALGARAGLYLADKHGPLNAKEEAFMSKLAGKLPLVAGSERAYHTFLNRIRADAFDQMIDGLCRDRTPTMAEAKAIANYVNAATGRGVLPGSLERAGTALNTVFFAPRYFASRVQLLTGQPMYGGTAATRSLIAKDYARFLAGLGVLLALGILAGGTLGTDPRASNFLKLRFGNTYVDPMMGMSQSIVLTTRLATGETKGMTGKVTPLRGPWHRYGEQDSAGLLSNFIRSKLAPVPASAVNLLQGKDAAGQPTDLMTEARRVAVPLSVMDVYQAMKSEGVPEGSALGLLGIMGMGLQTIDPKKAPPPIPPYAPRPSEEPALAAPNAGG